MGETSKDKKAAERRRDDAPQDEPGAEERFEQGLRRAVATPPKPHKEDRKADEKRRKSARSRRDHGAP